MQEVFKAGKIKREEVFIATKLWNNNHRPERVELAFACACRKNQADGWPMVKAANIQAE